MQYSIINRNATVSDFRLDAEAYLPIYLNLETIIGKKSYTTFEKECSIFTKGIFDIKADCYLEKGGVPFIRISDLGDILLKEEQIVNIPDEENNKNKKTFLERGDLILSKTACPAACFIDIDCCNVSQDAIAIKLKKDSSIKSHFLSVFLNTKYGFLQMQRWFTGNVQMHLNLSDSKKIRLPIMGGAFQGLIEKIIEDAIQTKKKTRKIYNDAEQILLSELSLLNWQPKHCLSFVKNYSDADKAGRIDAEYFQPKYDEIINAIQSYPGGWDTLGNLVKLKDKIFTPLDKTEYKYIELSNIAGNGEITDCMVEEGQDLPSRARRKVTTGDVIVSSIEGSLSSIALIEKEYDQALCSTGFHVINSKSLNSETLLVLMKSIVGQLQLKKRCSGTILTAVNQEEFKQVVLPKVDTAVQSQIRQKVTESFNLRKQSRHLLECAKRAVEIAIEQNEDAAIKWLQEQTEKATIKRQRSFLEKRKEIWL